MVRQKIQFPKFVQQLEREGLILDLKNRSSIGIFFIAFIGLTVFFTYSFNSRHPEFTYTFLGPLITICSLRVFHLCFFSFLAKVNPRINIAIFISSVLLTALIWGVGFLEVMMQEQEYPSQILMVMVTAGICSGGVVAYVPYRLLSLAYNLLIIWPSALYLLICSPFLPAGALFLAYSFYLFIITYTGNIGYWKAVYNEELLRKQSMELELLSRVDVLTGLFNRRHFDELYEYEWKRSLRNNAPLSVLLCDIDNFKLVNDQYGHMAGDEVLRVTADNLKRVFKRGNDIVCRYGGEEFIVVLCMTKEESLELAQQMCHLQEESVVSYKDQQLKTTISMGLASNEGVCLSSREELIELADKALYEAKSAGKNQVVTSP